MTPADPMVVVSSVAIDFKGQCLPVIRANGQHRDLIFGMLAICSACSGPPAEMEFSIGSHGLHAEIAATAESMHKGLSQRDFLADNQGMLFVFPAVKSYCMWMRDTHIPLSAAFLDAEGRILSIARMQPESLDLHCSTEPAKYVLEMNAGWFAERDIHARSRVSGLP